MRPSITNIILSYPLAQYCVTTLLAKSIIFTNLTGCHCHYFVILNYSHDTIYNIYGNILCMQSIAAYRVYNLLSMHICAGILSTIN